MRLRRTVRRVGDDRRRLRVLCTSTGGAGHIGAVAPIAVALRDAGHDVQWAVAPRRRRRGRGDGVRLVAGRADDGRTSRRRARRHRRGSCSCRWPSAAARCSAPSSPVRRRPPCAETWGRCSTSCAPTSSCARPPSWRRRRWRRPAASPSSRSPSAGCCRRPPVHPSSTPCDRCGRPKAAATRRGPTSTATSTSTRSHRRSDRVPTPARRRCVRPGRPGARW